MSPLARRPNDALAAGALLLLAGVLVACSNPRAWYRVDDYPGFTARPLIEFEEHIEKPTNGAPARMLKFDDELAVSCAYCHVDADATTGALTPEGTESRLMMDLADRFKVDCKYCHDHSPSKLTRAGRYALRDIRTPDRRWTCAGCHDTGFRVTRRG